MNGNHIPIGKGEDKDGAVKAFFDKKGSVSKKSKSDFNTVKTKFAKDEPDIKKQSYSYDPETGKSLDFGNKSEAQEFHKTYSGDDEPVYVIASTNNTNDIIDKPEIEKAYNDSIKNNEHTFIGKWTDNNGNVFKDISFTVKDETKAMELKSKFNQQVILKIAKDGKMTAL